MYAVCTPHICHQFVVIMRSSATSLILILVRPLTSINRSSPSLQRGPRIGSVPPSLPVVEVFFMFSGTQEDRAHIICWSAWSDVIHIHSYFTWPHFPLSVCLAPCLLYVTICNPLSLPPSLPPSLSLSLPSIRSPVKETRVQAPSGGNQAKMVSLSLCVCRGRAGYLAVLHRTEEPLLN